MSIYEPIESPQDARRHLQLRSPINMEPTGELICANEDDVAKPQSPKPAPPNPPGLPPA